MVENLEHSRRFLRPRIIDESAETSGGGPNQRVEPVSASSAVTFDVLADYIPATPGERHSARQTQPDTHSGAPARNGLPPGTYRPPYMGGTQKGGPR
jgi:type IV pilus assembly protein PilN